MTKRSFLRWPCCKDIGGYPLYVVQAVDHPVAPLKFAEKFLPEIGFPASKLKIALGAIDEHMFMPEVGESIEAIVIRDGCMLNFPEQIQFVITPEVNALTAFILAVSFVLVTVISILQRRQEE